MATSFKLFLILDSILIFSMVVGVSAGRCPRNVMKEAKRCMRHVHAPYSQRQASVLNMLLMPVQNGTKQLCRDGKIQNAFACLNRLYSSCAGSRVGMMHLDMMVDVGHWRNAIDNICNNMPYLEQYAGCESKARAEFDPCSKEAKRSFDQQMSFLKADLTSLPMNQQVEARKAQVDIACSFTNEILDCLYFPFQRYCPKQIAVLVKNTFQDFIPPACAKRAMQRSVVPGYNVVVEKQQPEMSHSRGDQYSDEVDQINDDDDDDDDGDITEGRGQDVSVKESTSFDEEYDVGDSKKPLSGVVVGKVYSINGAAEVRGGNGGGSGRDKNDDTDAADVVRSGGVLLLVSCVLTSVQLLSLL